MKMNVLHITNAFPIVKQPSYGIFIKEQIISLKERGINCDILFINSNEKGVKEYIASFIKNFRIADNYDIVHCHHPYSAFLYLLFRTKKSTKFITSFLNTLTNSGSKFISRYVFEHSDKIIVKDKKKLAQKYPEKVYYLPNGVNIELFRPIPKNECLAKLELTVGNYVLFCSAGGINRQQKRYDLFKETLKSANAKFGVNFKELLLTKVERELVPYYYNVSSVHLLTSDFEGSPNSVKEALACNLPVVSTNVGNVKEMLNGVEGCFVSESNDPNELADLLFQAYKNREHFNGRKTIKDLELDMNSIAHKLIKIYNDL
jgi:glycosyltransferase involved in cell wall biosynthesis